MLGHGFLTTMLIDLNNERRYSDFHSCADEQGTRSFAVLQMTLNIIFALRLIILDWVPNFPNHITGWIVY